MIIVKVHEAKTHLSRLLKEIDKGEEIIIQRGNVPVAKIVPLKKSELPWGVLKGRIKINGDEADIDGDEWRKLFGDLT